MIEIVKYLSPSKVLLIQDGQYYVVSESHPDLNPIESLVFKSDENGEVVSWSEVTGEIGVGLASFIPKLMEHGIHYKPWDDIPW